MDSASPCSHKRVAGLMVLAFCQWNARMQPSTERLTDPGASSTVEQMLLIHHYHILRPTRPRPAAPPPPPPPPAWPWLWLGLNPS